MRRCTIQNILRCTAAIAMAAAAATARAESVGNPLVPAPITDTAPGSIFRLNGSFTQPGVLTDWGIYDAEQPSAMQVTPVIYQRDSVNSWRVTGIGRTRNTTSLGAQSYAFDLVAGSAAVGPGSYFGWKDGGIGSNNTGVIEWFDGGVGSVDWLGPDHTVFNPGDLYPTVVGLNRTYSIQADTITGGGGPLETVGNPIVDAPIVDTAPGSLFVMTSNPFTEDGVVSDWRFFNGALREMTPLILEDVGGNYIIRGIGATIASSVGGEQHFDFNLVAGSDYVGPNYYFGWKDGGNGSNVTGVAEWSDGGPGTIWFGPDHTTFSVGDSLGGGVLALNRTYSIEANSAVIPEPSSITLGVLAISGMWVVHRVRSRGARS